MPKKPVNAGKDWTQQDVNHLRELANGNTPTRVIGLKTGRTESSVRSEAAKLGISLKPVNQSPYNRKK